MRIALICLVTIASTCAWLSQSPSTSLNASSDVPTECSIEEARWRSRILHEAFHGSLQVMHRDFFREDENPKIPSRSLEDVFLELDKQYGINLHWLAVDTKAMNVHHEPKTAFEKLAVAAIDSGKDEFAQVADNKMYFAGRIRLSSTCLSCHASRRSSNEDRAAALIIITPLNRETPDANQSDSNEHSGR